MRSHSAKEPRSESQGFNCVKPKRCALNHQGLEHSTCNPPRAVAGVKMNLSTALIMGVLVACCSKAQLS